MNTARKSLVLVAAMLLPAACATTDSARLAQGPTIEENSAYVAAVEQAARTAGVRVVWVNPPKQRKDE